MKKILFSIVLCLAAMTCFSQNIGIGVAEPVNKLHLAGNLLVNQVFVKTQAAPTPAQSKSLVNAATINFLQSDSTAYIYDPGGPAGDYIGNLNATANIFLTGIWGYELNFEDIDLGPGDSVIIHPNFGALYPSWYAVGNGFNSPGKITIPGSIINLTFKSNNDGLNGRGFRLLLRGLYESPNQENVTGFAGRVLFFEPKTGSLRSGIIDISTRGIGSLGTGVLPTASGQFSTALGYYATATGNYSVALGGPNIAQGTASTAIGYGTRAIGERSMAMGGNTLASGAASVAMGTDTKAQEWNATAMGNATTASAQHSTAMGNGSTASGTNSTAMGTGTSASGTGSTAIGNASIASGANAFVAGTSSLASGTGSVAIGTQVGATGINSTAMGNYVSTAGYNGAFIIGDNSTTTPLSASGNNAFRARFVGGYALFTGLGPSTGVVLNGGGNSWAAISDVRLKENFLPVNGEDILTRISKLPLTTWNYIGQDRSSFRHYGPMAQDFYKAFGHDGLGEIGCDTLINQQDFLGVNLVGIQALEKRTAEQRLEILALKEQNAKLFLLLNELTATQKSTEEKRGLFKRRR